MFFCKPCQPKVSLSLKFFNDIQEQQTDITSCIEKLEEQITKLVDSIHHSSEATSASQSNSYSSHQTEVHNVSKQTANYASAVGAAPTPNQSTTEKKFNVVVRNRGKP